MKKAEVHIDGKRAGVLWQDSEGYHFLYDSTYLENPEAEAVSKTLPIQREAFFGKVLFPFFDGLIPEGWLLSVAQKNWKLNPRDRMGLLLTCCHDCIGAVSIHAIATEES